MMPYFLLLAFIVAWARIERRHRDTSHGILSAVVGTLLFQFGWQVASTFDTTLALAAEAAGLVMAAVGVARIAGDSLDDTDRR